MFKHLLIVMTVALFLIAGCGDNKKHDAPITTQPEISVPSNDPVTPEKPETTKPATEAPKPDGQAQANPTKPEIALSATATVTGYYKYDPLIEENNLDKPARLQPNGLNRKIEFKKIECFVSPDLVSRNDVLMLTLSSGETPAKDYVTILVLGFKDMVRHYSSAGAGALDREGIRATYQNNRTKKGLIFSGRSSSLSFASENIVDLEIRDGGVEGTFSFQHLSAIDKTILDEIEEQRRRGNRVRAPKEIEPYLDMQGSFSCPLKDGRS